MLLFTSYSDGLFFKKKSEFKTNTAKQDYERDYFKIALKS